jgi:hypothetical protein
MLDGGLSPNYKDEYKNPLLTLAAGSGRGRTVPLLLERGADINARDRIGDTALARAITGTNPDIAMYLIQHGANVNTYNRLGASVAWAVYLRLERLAPGPVRTQFEQLRDLMIKKGAKWPPDSPEVVRDQMRAKGLTPIIPAGHKR